MRSAPTWKKLWHHFRLFQPILQFLTLLGALVILSRCSPLSPSTDKNILNDSSNKAAENLIHPVTPINAEKQIADDLNKALIKVPTQDAMIVTERDFESAIQQGIDLNPAQPKPDLPTATLMKAPKHSMLAIWRLDDADQMKALASEKAEARIDLSQLWSQETKEKRDELVSRLKADLDPANLKVKGAVFVVAAKEADLVVINEKSRTPAEKYLSKLTLTLSLSILDQDHAILVLRRVLPSGDDAEVEKTLEQQAISRAKFLGVVLGE